MAYTNKRSLPLLMAVWMANDRYDKDPSYLSGSQLSMSDRQIVLGYRAEDRVDLASLVPSRIGTAINDSIDAAWLVPNLQQRIREAGYSSLFEYEINPVFTTPGKVPVYIQQRYNEELCGRMLSGAPDIIISGRLWDYKSTSVFSYQKKTAEDYLWQLSTYRYLARDLIQDDVASIQFILRDWSEMRADNDPDYPQSPCPTLLVPVGTAEQCKARLITRIEALNALMSVDQAELPLCSDDELWLDPPKFAYYKTPPTNGKGRATRVFDSVHEANEFLTSKQGAGVIITRKGEPKACNYCKAASICQQRAQWNT